MIETWHWLVLGLLLVGAEVMGAGGFVLGAAIGAFIMAGLTYFAGITWEWQLVFFGVFSMIATAIVWKYFKQKQDEPDIERTNDRAAQLIGTRITLDVDLPTGQGKIQIGDTLWKVTSSEPLASGENTQVIGSQGMTLVLEKQL